MKRWQFAFLMAAIYLAPRVSSEVSSGLALIFTIAGFAFLLRSD